MKNADRVSTSSADILRVFQSKSQTKAFYNKICRFYDLLSDRSEAPMRKAGLAMLKASSGEKVLEIGFGTGHCLAELAKAVGSTGIVYGIDLSNGMLKLAQQQLKKAGLAQRVKLRCGDASSLPYPDSRLDAIFMSFTLELFDTPEIPQILAECCRTLRPGGRLVVAGMSKEGPKDPLVHVFEWTHRHFPNFLDCRPIYIRQSMEAAGFTIRKSLVRHMWIPVEIVLGIKS